MHDPVPVESFGIYGYGLPAFRAGFLHLERIEDQLPFHGWSARPHLHEGLDQILFFTRGGGRLLLEGLEMDFEAPTLMLMPAGTVHGFICRHDVRAPIVTVARNLSQAALAGLDHGGSVLAGAPQIWALHNQPRRLHEVSAAFDIMAHEYPHDDPGRQQMLMAGLGILFTVISRMQSPEAIGEDNLMMSGFMRLLERDYRLQPQVGVLADSLGVGTARLTRLCRKATGLTPQELLHDRLLTEAKRMLIYSSHPVSSISHMLGFREPAYFNRFFRRMTGLPPGRFRETVAQET